MYKFIRLLISFFAFLLIIAVAKKFHFNNFKKIMTIIILLFFCTLICVFPVENLFYTFNSSEDVFAYTKSGNILQISEGKKSSAVMYYYNGSSSVMFTKKSEDGYKICNGVSFYKVYRKLTDEVQITVYCVQGDYYVEILGTVYGDYELDITDSNETIFDFDEETLPQFKIIRTIQNIEYNPDYKIFVNGECFNNDISNLD